MPSSLSFEHASSTARLVYDVMSMLLFSSISSSCSWYSMPYDVFPVPGGPMMRNSSLACLALLTSGEKRP